LFGKPKRKRPLGSPRRIWEDNIKMDVREIDWEVVGWIYVTHDKGTSVRPL
jgi:hypothetical protein